jgi:hypothetical protein
VSAIEALQTTLAAEHAAVYVYGALGAQTSASSSSRLYAAVTDAYRTHLERRDALTEMLWAADEEPVAAEPGYELPRDLSSEKAVTRRALRLERSCGAAYAYLVANLTGVQRQFGITALLDAARRELDFGGAPRRLPGL